LGSAFDTVETNFFGRGVLNLGYAFSAWSEAYKSMFIGNSERTAYYLTEFIGLIIGVVTCVACLKYNPEVALFSLAVLVISWGSGPAQGIQRYILAAPAVFVMLARWGRNPIFDRAWTIFSLLLMGLLAMLFAFNYWVA
jgi:tetrahydromethanopterin S-methyltransferase subunit F